MQRLTDRTLEIPPFLARNTDGTFKHPGMPVPLITVAVKPAEPDPFAEAIAAANRRDAAVCKALIMHGDTSAKERRDEQAAARKAQKAAEADRLLKNKLKQREVFVQHFKWDHEK